LPRQHLHRLALPQLVLPLVLVFLERPVLLERPVPLV
jgi:hypothetical protein